MKIFRHNNKLSCDEYITFDFVKLDTGSSIPNQHQGRNAVLAKTDSRYYSLSKLVEV